ncbi:hypothetical protein OOT33_13590 [Sphingobium sp. DEHP117]|uniref:hypothetical protein n=1 Tax=Sphingobium sp. DEHP117 TaxID=2993436 RepID=UPI0027D4D151|nr:hypothetical protein [Sphingobium sp. DEHP117]MDQ4421455.1 hypothetical protein [Sphingobium sp. DEHP117]
MPIEGLRGADRVVASAISEGLLDYLGHVEDYNSLLARMVQARVAKSVSEQRLLALLERDAKDREEEQRRRIALADFEAGIETNMADVLVKPTPEQLRDPAFITRKVAAKHWADGGLTGYRRLHIDQITYLLSRGVLDDQTFAACKWYRDRYEAAEMEPTAPVAQYGETVRGDAVYGHLPRTEWAAEARTDIRWARGFIPEDIVSLFEQVVLHDVGITEVAKRYRGPYANVRAAFIHACHMLFEGVSHRLKV